MDAFAVILLSHNIGTSLSMPCVIFSQRQLDDQQLDDSQRERIEEFLRCKKDIHELHPEDFTKISELGSGNWGVVSRVRYNRTNIIMAKKTIRLDIKHEVGTQILRELEVGRQRS